MKKRIEPFEGSDEEKFLKALAKCRNCGHVRMAHQVVKNNICLDGNLEVTGKYMLCTCENYEPKDNLEFLEWQYKKKSERKK